MKTSSKGVLSDLFPSREVEIRDAKDAPSAFGILIKINRCGEIGRRWVVSKALVHHNPKDDVGLVGSEKVMMRSQFREGCHETTQLLSIELKIGGWTGGFGEL